MSDIRDHLLRRARVMCEDGDGLIDSEELARDIDAVLEQRQKSPDVPHECRHCRWLDSNGPLVPAGRPFCEQFRFCPPIEMYQHFGCSDWQRIVWQKP